MNEHVITYETRTMPGSDKVISRRATCSCGGYASAWLTDDRAAKRGGTQHVRIATGVPKTCHTPTVDEHW